ncbi:MAG: SAM-dependent chlorinase/fluorinase [Erysipelotrichaceae bacterium]|nr:SAM-dependent chlorinase/fluorinase [Erysipelotrichaceae bacterium]
MSNIVFQADFGVNNGTAGLFGICKSVDMDLHLHVLTFDVEHFNMKQAADNILDVYRHWPEGTIFANCVDPQTGVKHPYVCMALDNGSYVISADNETTDLLKQAGVVKDTKDITAVCEEYMSHETTHLVHGREIAYAAALLGSGKL